MKRRTALAVALLLAPASIAHAQPARCTHEVLRVQGNAVSATYCVTAVGTADAGRDLPVRVTESYADAHGSWSREATLQFIAGEADSRVIEDVPLDSLGMKGLLHLTLVLRTGLVSIEAALLTPGAVTVK